MFSFICVCRLTAACFYAIASHGLPAIAELLVIILSLLQSVMNCRVRRYKISHLSLNLLLHYLAKFKCSKYIRLQQLFNSKVVQNPLSTVNIYKRWYVFIHMCMQINCSMFLNCLLLASTRALRRARSVSMDAVTDGPSNQMKITTYGFC